jgi:predicted ester cyclase
VSFPGSEVYRVADGRIAEQWVVVDLLGLMTQLGALPAP